MSLRARVFRGAAKLLSASTFVTLLQFAFYITIVRVLGLQGLGAYFDTTILWTLTGFALTWPAQGFNRFVTGEYQAGRVERARHLYRLGVMIGLLGGLSAATAFIVLAPQAAALMFRSAHYAGLVRVLAVDMVLSSYNSYAGIGLGATMRFGKISLVQVLWALARYLTGIALLIAGYGPLGLIAGWVAGDLVNAVFNTYWSRDLLLGPTSAHPLRPVIKFAAPLALSGAVVSVLQSFDRIFVLAKLGLAELGSYSTIMLASGVPQMLPGAIAGALGPAMIGLEERGELRPEAVEKAVRYITTLSIPPLLLIAAVGRPLVLLFLGPSFVHDWEAFTILTVGHSLMTYDIPISMVLAAKRDSKALAMQSVVTAATIALLAPPLIDLWFAAGAAIAYVVARLVGFLAVAMPRVKRYGLLRVDLGDYARLALASIIVFAGTLSLGLATGLRLVLLPAYIAFGLALTWASVRALHVLDADDYGALMEALPAELHGVMSRLWRGLGLPLPNGYLDDAR
ncbi:polysaccharide biosynthesis protein [Acidilobus saccharovorans 345-15]|uniref:Polysaccharide biosynthesis protein n=1 Tax=Acidilobus saccharovorans (strain DSM 16705 / JCM 18335 / VKM B-2471 / 345-15) TaxID=666510 RepID=D9Q175_ACIS3|nr:oligosaccharide flippase family protein [Acidilobus saccharovorans]ADL19063.1 polysaccharide biosynthesis protein [Acidilobus saccharovorans 345-15]